MLVATSKYSSVACEKAPMCTAFEVEGADDYMKVQTCEVACVQSWFTEVMAAFSALLSSADKSKKDAPASKHAPCSKVTTPSAMHIPLVTDSAAESHANATAACALQRKLIDASCDLENDRSQRNKRVLNVLKWFLW